MKLGRTFLPEEDVLGHAKRGGLELQVLARKNRKSSGDINLDGQKYLVAEACGFSHSDFAEMWDDGLDRPEQSVRGEHHYIVIARLKENVDLKQAHK